MEDENILIVVENMHKSRRGVRGGKRARLTQSIFILLELCNYLDPLSLFRTFLDMNVNRSSFINMNMK